ncbi:MAG: hypothetical protein MJY99_06765 [Fibrobacter sp.]|nr:hypothetical protein [Fibrobacter sp.]
MSKVETLKNALAIPAMIAAAFALAACAGAPSPATDPVDEAKSDAKGPITETAENSTATAADKPAANADSENSALFVSNALDSYRLATPESKFADNANDIANSEATATATQITDTSAKASTVADPYTSFPALAESVFAYADSLYKAGQTDAATAYLERFRIIKPLWDTWEARTDSMLAEFGKARAAQSKQFEPVVLEIQNMNRAQAAYSMVVETADSLIALAPGDSLTNWATAQKQIAYKNTFAKAQKEYAQIKSKADDQAKFADAIAQAEKFQMRYRDFEDTLHIQALIDHIRSMAESADSAAIKYWEKNDPAKALAKADTLIKTEKFSAAKELLNKLKASNLRAQAIQKYQKLADAYCNKQRKETSQIFTKAQKQKDEAKKRTLLKQAIAPLDKCLAEYPENSQKQKVLENKQFLEKELAK